MKRASRQTKRPTVAGEAVPASFDWRLIAAGATLVGLVLLVYWPTFEAGFIWDDGMHVTGNTALRSLGGLRDIWFKLGAVPQYYPLVHTTFWIEYRLWGQDPAGYHAVNVLLHAASAVLLWRLLLRLAVPGAWLAAAIFAVHPVEVESAAWVTERKNVLSCLLALGSLWAYLRFRPADAHLGTSPAVVGESGSLWFYFLSLVLYVLALWSKTVTASVPAVLLVIYWWKRGRIGWRDVAPLLPFFAVGLALASITVWMERTLVGAEGDDWNLSAVERLLIAGRAAWFYAGKLLWPYPLMFFYPRWTIDASAWWQYLYPLAALLVLGVLWACRRRIGRGPLAAALIFGGVLVPALGFFNVYPFRFSFVADHFQYHASIALIALMAAALTTWANRLDFRPGWLAPLGAVAILLPLAVIARGQARVYDDLFTLYGDVVAKNPDSWIARNNLGRALLDKGQHEQAIVQFREAARTAPELARIRINWGQSLLALGRRDDAERELLEALKLQGDDRDRANAHVQLAILDIRREQYDQAIAHAAQAIALFPESPDALYNWGVALAAQGQLEPGIAKVRAALAMNPDFAVAHHELGAMLMALGRGGEAISPLREAVEIEPEQGQYRLDFGIGLLNVGEVRLAEAQLRKALRQIPRSAEAHYWLGMALLRGGNHAGAIAEFQAALQLDPRHAAAAEQLRAAGGIKTPRP